MLTYNDLGADQLDCIDFILDGDDCLVCADVGTGKTVIAETVAERTLAEGRIKRWLVLGPLMVCDDVWRSEHTEWEHLTGLKVAVACGPDEAERIAALESDAQIVVVNYENLAWLLDRYPIEKAIVDGKRKRTSTLPFDGLICDEVDKLKSVSTNRFKAFRDHVPHFAMRIGLTGTILPNHLLELWGQTFIVDAGQSFGRSFYKFREEYFYPTDYHQYKWAPLPDTYEHILDKLTGLAYRLKAVGLPPVVVREPARLQLPAHIKPIYRELHRELFLLLEDKKGKTRKVDAANHAVLTGKLQQICAGFSYVDREVCVACEGKVVLDEKGKRRCEDCNRIAKPEAVWHSHDKFDWLDTVLAGAQQRDEQVLVFYHFVEELDELRRRYPDMRYLGGGLSRKNKRESVALWNSRRLPYLALHPASAGHGLNLQKGGAHNIAFLTLPWSGGMFKQVTGRLARRGQSAAEVFVHAPVFAGTIDEEVLATVTGKLDGLETFLDDLYEWQNAA